jgi:hypothetical protein
MRQFGLHPFERGGKVDAVTGKHRQRRRRGGVIEGDRSAAHPQAAQQHHTGRDVHRLFAAQEFEQIGAGRRPRALFQNAHPRTSAGQIARHHGARRARSDHENVGDRRGVSHAGALWRERSEGVNESGVAEQCAQTPPIKAQSAAVPVGTALNYDTECNAERGCFGARSGHGGLVHTLSSRQQLPQHEGQDAAVAVVIDLDRRVDAQLELDLLLAAVRPGDGQQRVLLRPQGIAQIDGEGLVALDAQ